MKRKVIFDLEATCTKTGEFPRDEMEIIEIGAVDTDGKEFASFIKPVRNPELTDFCKELTTIKQSDVDTAAEFKEVYAFFKDFFEDATLISWGDYDRKQMIKDLEYHGIKDKYINYNHINLKQVFLDYSGLKRAGVNKALSWFNLEFEGTKHRGIDDAKNIIKIYDKLVEVLGEEAFN